MTRGIDFLREEVGNFFKSYIFSNLILVQRFLICVTQTGYAAFVYTLILNGNLHKSLVSIHC